MSAKAARLRWAVALGAWEPSPDEFAFLLGLLPEEERTSVLRFRQEADKRRALVSRLLQRAAAAAALGLPHASVVVRRTRGSKPYAANELDKPHAPNWNYSVSHEVRRRPLGSGGSREGCSGTPGEATGRLQAATHPLLVLSMQHGKLRLCGSHAKRWLAGPASLT